MVIQNSKTSKYKQGLSTNKQVCFPQARNKILISLTYYLPNISGITIYANILAKKLSENYQVTLLSSRFRKDLKSKEIKNKIIIKRVWGPIKINKGILMPTFPLVSLKEVIKTDLVICHLPQLESIWLAIWAKILKKPIILVHHCEFGNTPNLLGQLIKIITYLPHYFTYKLADQIIAYTEDYARCSIFLSKSLKKTKFILPPVVIKRKNEKKIKLIAKKLGKNKKTKIIGFVGRLGWEKGIDLILKTIPKLRKEFKEFKIVFVGPYKKVVGDKTYHKLKGTFQKYKDYIVLTGPIPRGQLANYYYNFDCLLLPSTNNLETFGIVQPEAMLCGCPVVTSNLPGVRIPIKLTGMGKIIPINNHQKLARAVIEVIKNKKEFQKNKAITKKIFNKKTSFNQWQKVVDKYLGE